MGGHTLHGRVVRQEHDVVDVCDTGADHRGMADAELLWRFESMTSELWRRLVDGEFVRVNDSLAKLDDVIVLKNVLTSELLEDWWQEHPDPE